MTKQVFRVLIEADNNNEDLWTTQDVIAQIENIPFEDNVPHSFEVLEIKEFPWEMGD